MRVDLLPFLPSFLNEVILHQVELSVEIECLLVLTMQFILYEVTYEFSHLLMSVLSLLLFLLLDQSSEVALEVELTHLLNYIIRSDHPLQSIYIGR
jgi:hypothetical protein